MSGRGGGKQKIQCILESITLKAPNTCWGGIELNNRNND